MDAFDRAFRIVVGIEGGYVNNPADPGGETKWGVSKRSYPSLNIAELTEDDARGIYWRDYWLPTGCDQMPGPLALLIFDAAVNSGVRQAKILLQQALGVKADGIIGPVTQLAIAAHAGKGAALCAELMARRTVFMAGLPTWGHFGLGWSRRLAILPYHAVNMAGVS